MPPALKTRLIGAAVLIALAVIIVPLFFSAEPPGSGGEQSISLDIPATPDRELQTRTMSVAPAASSSGAAQAVPGNQLATVDIPSRRPQDVHPEAGSATANPADDSAQASPQVAAPPATETATPPKPEPEPAAPEAEPKPAAPAAKAAQANAGTAAKGRYQINLGAYATRANAEKLVAGVRKLGYPVGIRSVDINGKPGARVDAGPFDSRAAAEAARLRIKAALPRAPAKLVAASSDQHGDAPAKALPAKRAGGWAVQVVAYSTQADAVKLRDRLRGAGFDSYVDDVASGGKTLWRVRVGPQAQRADAESLRARLKTKMKLDGVIVTVP